MFMLPNEAIILESDGKTLVLTSHRVRYRASAWGAEEVISIMLDEVSSCGLIHNSYPILLILAAVSGLGFASGLGGQRVGWLVICALLVGGYFATRRQVLAIASAGHTIKSAIAGMNTNAVMKFLEEVEAAKNARRSR